MPQVTTTELIERAKLAADIHDNFVTPRQWMYWASQERMALDIFIARSGWTQSFETIDITVDGTEDGVFTISPADGLGVMAVVAVHQIDSDGPRRLEYKDPASWSFYQTDTAEGNSRYYRCKRVGDEVEAHLAPLPSVGETYRVTYLPHPPRLTVDAAPATGYTNAVSYPMGWEEYIVLGMAVRAADKEESDSRALERQMDKIKADIEQLNWDRSFDGMAVINSDADRRGWNNRIVLPSAASWWWA